MDHVWVTLLYGSLSALLVGALGVNVSRLRVGKQAFVGAAQDPELTQAVRAHGNATEYVPLQILLLLLLELSGVSGMPLHLLGGLIFTSRLLHAVGVLLQLRVTALAALVSYLVTFAMAIWGLVIHFR